MPDRSVLTVTAHFSPLSLTKLHLGLAIHKQDWKCFSVHDRELSIYSKAKLLFLLYVETFLMFFMRYTSRFTLKHVPKFVGPSLIISYETLLMVAYETFIMYNHETSVSIFLLNEVSCWGMRLSSWTHMRLISCFVIDFYKMFSSRSSSSSSRRRTTIFKL